MAAVFQQKDNLWREFLNPLREQTTGCCWGREVRQHAPFSETVCGFREYLGRVLFGF